MGDWIARRKDTLDVALKVLSFLATTAIAGIGFWYTSIEHGKTEWGRTLDLMSKAEALTNSQQARDRKLGWALLGALDNVLAPDGASEQEKAWLTALVYSLQDQSSAAQPTPQALATPAADGWVYLGQYQNGAWDTAYLDGIVVNGKPQRPALLVGKTLTVSTVTGALNVRSGAATEHALMPVKGSLKPGVSVQVLQVQQVPNNPHYWAQFKKLGP